MLASKLGVSQKLVLEEIPKFVLDCLKQPKKDVIIDFEKVDPVLSSSLLPFQVEGLKWVNLFQKSITIEWYNQFCSFGIDKNGRCLIADDMGLGKTFQALAIANYYKEDWPMLIVTTASMR